MDRQEPKKVQDIKNSNFENKKLKTAKKFNNNKDTSLPWWVELLFVQIGLPDKWLIKLLKSKKSFSVLLKNEKRFIITFILFFSGLTYFYPVIKYSKTKLNCEATAKSYIKVNKNLNKVNKKQLRMLSTNFCNGGREIYEIDSQND